MRSVGIDFGTTNCAVAVATGGVVETARFGVSQALETFRSVLFFEGAQSRGRKRPLAGPSAIDAYLTRETPGRLIQSLKSFLSSALFRETWVHNERYSVEDLTAAMALSLREEAERQLGDLGKRVVVGRPVRFVGADTDDADALAVSRLDQAFRRAGFDEIQFEFEPIGAAYFYESTLDHNEKIVIADFGGGTSDFSLLKVGPRMRGRGILSTAGLPLAGDSFDAKIVRNVVSPMLGLGSEYRSLDKMLPIPRSVYLKLEKWHHLSFLKTQETLRMLRSLQAQAEEPSKIEALLHLIESDAGYNLHRAVQRTKVELSSREHSEFVYEDPCVSIRQTVRRSDFEDWIDPQLSQISRLRRCPAARCPHHRRSSRSSLPDRRNLPGPRRPPHLRAPLRTRPRPSRRRVHLRRPRPRPARREVACLRPGNIDHLPSIKRRDRVNHPSVRPFHRPIHHRPQLFRGVCTPQGRDPVRRINAMQKRTDEDPEQHHRNPMTHQIQHDQPLTRPRNIADQLHNLCLRKMMHHANRQCDIGRRQRIANRVTRQNRNPFELRSGPQIEAHHVDPELSTDLLQQRALPAADIEHPSNRMLALAQPAKNLVRIPQQALRPCQIAICLRNHLRRQQRILQQLDPIDTILHDLYYLRNS